MVPPIAKTNQRGSALLETLPTATILLVFVAGLLMAAYLMFGRAWIMYQAEQSLYCVSEAKPAALCRRQLSNKLNQFLPWGRISKLSLHQSAGQGRVEIKWSIQNFSIRIAKQMSMRQIVRKRDLR